MASFLKYDALCIIDDADTMRSCVALCGLTTAGNCRASVLCEYVYETKKRLMFGLGQSRKHPSKKNNSVQRFSRES